MTCVLMIGYPEAQMPNISKPCSNYPCPNTAVYRGRCAACNGERDERRGTTKERGYSGSWVVFRKFFLQQPDHCLCFDCKAEGYFDRPATEVHHLVKLRSGGPKLDERNCLGLCKM